MVTGSISIGNVTLNDDELTLPALHENDGLNMGVLDQAGDYKARGNIACICFVDEHMVC
jgi:hypothetical protein